MWSRHDSLTTNAQPKLRAAPVTSLPRPCLHDVSAVCAGRPAESSVSDCTGCGTSGAWSCNSSSHMVTRPPRTGCTSSGQAPVCGDVPDLSSPMGKVPWGASYRMYRLCGSSSSSNEKEYLGPTSGQV
jgi:hypothetical protein